MTEQNLYRCTPRQTRSHVLDILEAGLVPNVISSPGMGKSSIMRSIAQETGVHLIDHRLSTSAPEDLSGLPTFKTLENGQTVASFAPFDIFPIAGTPIPTGKNGWLLFFDEFNSGTKMVQAACYKTILDKMIGQAHLHERVAIACAGNLMTDRAITNTLSTAMQSRVVHIEMMLSHQEWLEDVAFAEDYDERIIAYLNYDENELMDFRPEHQDKTFCCPRTWEFMNRLVKGKTITDSKTSLYAGTITSGSAAKFVQFCNVYKTLLSINDVLADPEGANVPYEVQSRWAIVSHLIGKITDDDFGNIAKYINRFDLSFRVLFFRGALAKHPQLRGHPAFAKAMVDLSKYLNGKIK